MNIIVIFEAPDIFTLFIRDDENMSIEKWFIHQFFFRYIEPENF